jgi:protein translocase SEC61 complex gamma subunit
MKIDFNKAKEWTKSEFFRYLRVWNLLKKPNMKEFKTVAGVSALGLLIIGGIGFIVSTIIRPFFR